MYCQHCGKPILDGANFCTNCGSRISSAPVPPEPETPVTVPNVIQHEHIVQTPVFENVVSPFPEQPAPLPHKKGSLKAPLIVLSVLSLIGLILYFLIPLGDTPNMAQQVQSDTPWFEVDRGSLYFYEYAYTGSGELTVPETVNGVTVTAIGEFCFSECDSLTTVILPGSVERIDSLAFYDCDSLRGIYIPESVTEIGEEAFADCDALEAISLPASLELLDESVFNDCQKLKYVFFGGTREQWKDLYHGKTGRITTVYCSDGKLPLA